MPANLSPEYKAAEQAFRRAREPRERLDCLREMLRAIPKHKGTEHLQADIKSRIKQLTDELGSAHGGRGHGGALYSVRHEGAAQVCLLGPPNSGKSSLHAALTGAKSEIGPYPFTTTLPLPGMLPFEDIHIQLVDLPPIGADYLDPWLPGLVQFADAALLVVDLSDPDCMDHVVGIRDQLARRRIVLSERWPGLSAPAAHQTATADEEDAFGAELPTLLVANKSDLDPDPEEVKVLEELLGVSFPALATSAVSGSGLAQIGPLLFHGLDIARVYTKAPGKPAQRDHPFTVRRGDTVLEVARLVHQDIARDLRFARIWGSGEFDGQQVGPEHRVADGDVVELHVK